MKCEKNIYPIPCMSAWTRCIYISYRFQKYLFIGIIWFFLDFWFCTINLRQRLIKFKFVSVQLLVYIKFFGLSKLKRYEQSSEQIPLMGALHFSNLKKTFPLSFSYKVQNIFWIFPREHWCKSNLRSSFSRLNTLCTPLVWMRITAVATLHKTSGYVINCSVQNFVHCSSWKLKVN